MSPCQPLPTFFLAAGTKAPIEQAVLGKHTTAGSRSQFRRGHSLCLCHSLKDGLEQEQHFDPQDNSPFPPPGLGDGEGGLHFPPGCGALRLCPCFSPDLKTGSRMSVLARSPYLGTGYQMKSVGSHVALDKSLQQLSFN